MKVFLHIATLVVVLGTVHLTRAGLADGAPLPAGTYEVRATDETLVPALGQSPEAERWVEFLRGGKVVAREVATVVSAADIDAVAKGMRPIQNGSRIQLLKGGVYVRVWINKNGTNYLIHLRTGR